MKQSKAALAMRKAWEIFKKAGVRTMAAWSAALRKAWAIVKGVVKEMVSFDVRHQPSGGREWVAEITGRHPKYKYNREFLKYSNCKWSYSGKTGSTTYELEEGKIYEVNEPWVGRYFVKVENGAVIEISAEDVEKALA